MGRRWVSAVLPADYLLFHFGYFGLLPVLAALVSAQLGGGRGAAAAVGTALFAFNAAIGGACLLLAPWVSRLPYRTGMALGLAGSAAGMGVLPYAHSTATIVAALLLGGTGMSVHGLLARALIAEVIHDKAGQNRVFSLIQIAVNVSAAIGPMVATWVYAVSGGRVLLTGVAACYLAACLLVLATVPGVRPQGRSALRWPISLGTLRAVGRDPLAVRTVVVSAAGGFLYAQFFSAIALLIARSVHVGPGQGTLFLVNAVVVVALQAPVSAVVDRRLRRGVAPLRMMLLGLATFAAAMLVLGVLLQAGVPAFVALFAAIVVFSVAETVYTPIVNTAYANLPASSPIEAFNLRQVFVTVGESVGALSGAGIFLTLARTGPGVPYWLALAGFGLLVAAGAAIGGRGRAAGADPDPGTPTDPCEESLHTDGRHSDDRDDRLEPGLAHVPGPDPAAAQRGGAGGA